MLGVISWFGQLPDWIRDPGIPRGWNGAWVLSFIRPAAFHILPNFLSHFPQLYSLFPAVLKVQSAEHGSVAGRLLSRVR